MDAEIIAKLILKKVFFIRKELFICGVGIHSDIEYRRFKLNIVAYILHSGIQNLLLEINFRRQNQSFPPLESIFTDIISEKVHIY